LGKKVVDAAVANKSLKVTEKDPDLSEMKKFLNRKRKKNFKTLLGDALINTKYLQLNLEQIKDLVQD